MRIYVQISTLIFLKSLIVLRLMEIKKNELYMHNRCIINVGLRRKMSNREYGEKEQVTCAVNIILSGIGKTHRRNMKKKEICEMQGRRMG